MRFDNVRIDASRRLGAEGEGLKIALAGLDSGRLGIAAVVLQTVVGLCVFLAYGTTSSVARHLGAGDRRGALAQGVDGLWLAVVIGLVATLLGVVADLPDLDA